MQDEERQNNIEKIKRKIFAKMKMWKKIKRNNIETIMNKEEMKENTIENKRR